MRIDKFLSTTNILKKRSIAQDMINEKLISINGVVAKANKKVKSNDIITIKFLEYNKQFEVLAIPTTKTIPKETKNIYVREINK